MGPGDWEMVAQDIEENYYHFDGFVVLMGTDTMAYAASALTFMFQNLGKPVVFTGSQIPLREPYNDARKNLIMAVIFASSDTVSEVTIFFHDRCFGRVELPRSTLRNSSPLTVPTTMPWQKSESTLRNVNTCFNLLPKELFEYEPKWTLAARETHLKGLILQLYGTGNMPSLKDDLVNALEDATIKAGVCVVVTTQCQTGSVLLGHLATGQALIQACVVSAGDMTLEATTAKLAYLLGRQDLTLEEVRRIDSQRGHVTTTIGHFLPKGHCEEKSQSYHLIECPIVP
eukprot:scaffold1070_cov140-Cylindrotheca_fusiformis.AAC.3